MSESRSRLNLVFKPTPEEKALPWMLRARFAMMGATEMKPMTRESQPELYAMLESVSEKAGIQTPIAYLWDSNKAVANAVAVSSKPPLVAFSKTITEILTTEELAAVAGHELGHVKNIGHSGKMYWLAAFGGMAVADMIGRPIQRGLRNQMAQGNSNPVLGAAHSAITVGRFVAPMAAGAVASRSEELAADRHGAMTMGAATPLISALEKLTQHSHDAPKTPYDRAKEVLLKPLTAITRSHPTFEKRRDALGVTPEQIEEYRATQGDSTHVHKPGDAENHPTAGMPLTPSAFAEEAIAPSRTWQDRMQARDQGALER